MAVNIAIISASVAILSLVGNFYQIRAARDAERLRTTMEVVARTRLPEFVAAYRRISDAQENSAETDCDYLMGEFNYLVTFYLNGMTNECLIKAAAYDSMQAFRQVLTKIHYGYPRWQLQKIDRALASMNATKCSDDLP